MKKSLRLLISGIPGGSLPSSLESSSGRELRSPPSLLRARVVSRAREALAAVDGLSKVKRMALILGITQALDTIADAELLEMMATVRSEVDAILSEFGSE